METIKTLDGREYLERLPTQVPEGKMLVHNNLKPNRPKRLGTRFRAWLQLPADNLKPCDCGWAPELGVHYYVKRD
jgi:hypothetical protein